MSGGIFGGINGYYGKEWGWERLAANATAGGVSAKISGGDFSKGFGTSLLTGSAKWYYTSNVGYGPNPLPGWNREQGVDQTYRFDPETGRQYADSIYMSVVGGNNTVDFCRQGSTCSRLLNLVPGINATAGYHDWIFNRPDASEQTTLANIGTMVPAAALSYSALINGPLTVQLSTSRK